MIEYVKAAEVTLDDLAWIKEDNEAHPEVETLSTEEVMINIQEGTLHMLRWSGLANGITLFRATTGGRIEVLRTIGDNQLFHWSELVQALRLTAREWGCTQIESLIYDRRVAGALQRLGATVEALQMVLEVGDADASS